MVTPHRPVLEETLAHDLNNMLTAITSNLELIEEMTGGLPEVQERVEAALRATERGEELIRRLLAFARQ